jgi:predicted O-linked N-acetylglucosamine transferase (SPINDLY family)
LSERRKWADSLLKTAGGKRRNPALKKDRLKKDRHKTRLKIGYVSAFFHKDNWMKPVWGLIGQHDRTGFQIHLLSDRTELTPAIQAHLQPLDRFHDLSALSNDEAADAIAALGIDILVDLNGYSYPKRLPLFLRKPAPLLVGWFNMYATTGFDCFDYLVGDECVIPVSEARYYSEKIARVKGSYLTFSIAYDVPAVVEPPCISNGFITFGSLISQYKITENVIDAWCEILQRSPGSRLLIRNAALGKHSNRQFVRSRFTSRGIADERVALEGPARHFEFLETYDRIDIALDAFPYNGGTTTTEALWQGVPVLSYRGDRWASRTSATLLLAAGLDELLANDISGYVEIATRLAGQPGKLQQMRENMRERLLRSQACDTASFARSMEKLYREIWAH